MKILSAEYVLPISAEPIHDGAIVYEKDKIVALGKREELIKDFSAAEHENFGEAVIMPGFVNAHSHLEITAMRNFLDDVEHDFSAWLLRLSKVRAEHLSDADIEIAALWGAVEGIRAGITFFADIGRYGAAGFEALKASGLRGTVYQETNFSPDDETAEVDFETLKDKFLELKQDETELVRAGISPHSPYTVGPLLFRKITEYALRENVPLSIHAAESAAEAEFLLLGEGHFAEMYKKFGKAWRTPGKSTIEYLHDLGVLRAKPLLAHCVNVSDRDIEILAKTGASVAHCPKSNAKFGHGIAPYEKFLASGVRVGFGSDSVAGNNICDILEEARFAALFARSRADKNELLSAQAVLETATFGGANAIGARELTGTLEAGKQADFIVISLKETALKPVHEIHAAVLFAASARDVILNVTAGRELYRDGRVTTVDEEILEKEMRRIAEKMRVI